MSITATITSKGQITLPRNVRKALGSNTVEIKVEGETVVLMPIRSVAGALGKYAGEKVLFDEVREKVWEEVADAEKR
ncbi:MAG: AbrB/MazE/SpoVT family DNA-binding domain-containing protein [Syntrophales bacterium]|nr:AbrB/MazE/SpoVT family DNA-binding domain-containing protein [Syntrophales bacterium]